MVGGKPARSGLQLAEGSVRVRVGKVGPPFPIDRQKPLKAPLPHERGHTVESRDCRGEYHNVYKGRW